MVQKWQLGSSDLEMEVVSDMRCKTPRRGKVLSARSQRKLEKLWESAKTDKACPTLKINGILEAFLAVSGLGQ